MSQLDSKFTANFAYLLLLIRHLPKESTNEYQETVSLRCKSSGELTLDNFLALSVSEVQHQMVNTSRCEHFFIDAPQLLVPGTASLNALGFLCVIVAQIYCVRLSLTSISCC
jgi:hypothetical protein